MILSPVAPFSQSMSPWRATATHFVPKSLVTNMTKTCSNHTKPPKLIYNLSKRSINIKNSTNVSTKLYNFDINLPGESLFGNPDHYCLWPSELQSRSQLFQSRESQARPALRNAGRSSSKSRSFAFKSQPSNPRSPGKLVETCPLEKRRDPRCATQVALFSGTLQKWARPALHWPGSSKTSKFIYKSWCNPGRTDFGSWSYWAPTSHRIAFIQLAKSETLYNCHVRFIAYMVCLHRLVQEPWNAIS